jgi:hypothetical protein
MASETRADFWNPQAAHCPVEDADAGDAPSSATSATVIAGSPEPDLIRVVIDTFPAMICGGRATQQRCEHQPGFRSLWAGVEPESGG